MNALFISSRSISIDLNGKNPYYNNEYDVYLNNNLVLKSNKNVFTLYDLTPNTNYELKINNDVLCFKTLSEDSSINIKDFNAIGDGIIDDTSKIQAAIILAKYNSTIIIPKGNYLISSIYLKSNITLYLEKGAKLIAKTNRKDFPIHPSNPNCNYGIWEGIEEPNFASIINIINAENVSIIGEGEIDGRALDSDWYVNHRIKNIAWRGHLIYTKDSNNIHIIGPYFHNSQSWAIHPYMSSNIDIINIKIENIDSMPTTDGIDPDCVNMVRILGNYISVGDDCIAIKSGSYELAKKYEMSSSDIIIKDNYFEKGHGGIVFGSELSGGINKILVTKCIFNNTDRGFRLKTRRGRGHINPIDNITFDNNIMNGVKTPFVINMYYNMGNKGGHEEYVWTYKYQEFCDLTPVLGKFRFTNTICNNVEYAAGVFLGLAESKIGQISFKNVTFNYNLESKPGYPVMIEHNIEMNRAGIYARNVEEIVFDNVIFNGNATKEIERIEDGIDG